jgi:hypothetical protein
MSNYKINGNIVSKKEFDDYLNDDQTIVENLSIELPNPNKSKSITMEGFDIPADLLVSMANKNDKMKSIVTCTFSNCGKLGGKTVTIMVE